MIRTINSMGKQVESTAKSDVECQRCSVAFILYTRDKNKIRESRGGERIFTMTLLSMLQDTGQGTVNGRLHAEG